MATEKLYYQDPNLRSFTTQLRKIDQDEKGRLYAVLEKTAFYPTGGGQPHDTGTMNGIPVYDVEEVEGEIRHYLQEPLGLQDEYVGVIDWERRFDHMQQHAGQHILSAAFENQFGYPTVSFHLGKDTCTIDLHIPSLSDEEAEQAEKLANQMILENRPIETKWVTKEELTQYMLRKDLSVSENIRLVIIPDFDYNGCGGTHPESTGKVSSIKILHWEKQKKNMVRLYFVCGNRVLQQLHHKHQMIQSMTSILNAPQEQMKEATQRLVQQTKDLEKTVSELKTQLLEYEAQRFIEKAKQDNESTIKGIFFNRPITELQQLAKSMTLNRTDILVYLVNEVENKLQFVCARGQDLNVNMNQIAKCVLPLINGKGGGNDAFAQGGGVRTISGEELMEELNKQVTCFNKI
ncbi:DHHA1 domain-containing protein [Ammoniphilus sp. YIM 78166]|uniref:alanyl-tRNA editing protein n=1 Tax=Ammoniphilus sp. YIM 78166 TaxID=1644106 RepID=UPI00106FED70|nr:DHHA1 domain-containing protein [Ammoniphilus sp. YIM 78166]